MTKTGEKLLFSYFFATFSLLSGRPQKSLFRYFFVWIFWGFGLCGTFCPSQRYPPLVLSFTQAHLCDTPFCNISRDNCAIPHKEQARKSFAILSLQVSRDMKSIAAGPLSPYRGQTWKIGKMTFLGSKNCLFWGCPWNHLNGLFGGFNFLPLKKAFFDPINVIFPIFQFWPL